MRACSVVAALLLSTAYAAPFARRSPQVGEPVFYDTTNTTVIDGPTAFPTASGVAFPTGTSTPDVPLSTDAPVFPDAAPEPDVPELPIASPFSAFADAVDLPAAPDAAAPELPEFPTLDPSSIVGDVPAGVFPPVPGSTGTPSLPALPAIPGLPGLDDIPDLGVVAESLLDGGLPAGLPAVPLTTGLPLPIPGLGDAGLPDLPTDLPTDLPSALPIDLSDLTGLVPGLSALTGIVPGVNADVSASA